MHVSFHEAVVTLRYYKPERLRPQLAEFVEEQLRQLSGETTTIDAQKTAVARLRELGGPWFAFTSYVLPGWTWVTVPIQQGRRVEAHVRWLEMRIDDFAREIERLGQLLAFEEVGLEPGTFVQHACRAELPRVVEAFDNSGESYDAIQLTCNLMIEAARLPNDEVVREVINGFFHANQPTEEALETFIDDLADSLSQSFSARYGAPPYSVAEGELIGLERRTDHIRWEIQWLHDRIEEGTYLDEAELKRISFDLSRLEEIEAQNTERLEGLFNHQITTLETMIEELEAEWIGANDRDSVVTEARLDANIGNRITRLTSLKARREELLISS